jgi:hypothetical protein
MDILIIMGCEHPNMRRYAVKNGKIRCAGHRKASFKPV